MEEVWEAFGKTGSRDLGAQEGVGSSKLAGRDLGLSASSAPHQLQASICSSVSLCHLMCTWGHETIGTWTSLPDYCGF